MNTKIRRHTLCAALCVVGVIDPRPGRTADELPAYLADRGTGIPLSMFGTYIRKGELVIYPFFEYYRDGNLEYQPDELGSEGEGEFRGKYRAKEGLLFVGYGLSESLAIEFEAAYIKAELTTSTEDLSSLPDRLEQSGIGDVEGQLRLRLATETDTHPELFTYFETVFADRGTKPLIDTPTQEYKLGAGLIRGFGFGTITLRGAIEYSDGANVALGEYALEYLKKLSPAAKILVAIEGSQDEASLLTELQVRLSPKVTLKLNSGFGLTSKATDWAPELGIVFRF